VEAPAPGREDFSFSLIQLAAVLETAILVNDYTNDTQAEQHPPVFARLQSKNSDLTCQNICSKIIPSHGWMGKTVVLPIPYFYKESETE
jgi:hypothetical protein